MHHGLMLLISIHFGRPVNYNELPFEDNLPLNSGSALAQRVTVSVNIWIAWKASEKVAFLG